MNYSDFIKRTIRKKQDGKGYLSLELVIAIFVFLAFSILSQSIKFGFTAGLFFYIIIFAQTKINKKKVKKKYQFLADQTSYTNSFLQLISLIIKADAKTTDSEIRYVEKALVEHYSQEKVQLFIERLKNVYLKKDLTHVRICRFILENYTLPERIQIIHLISGVATADGLLTKKELDLLKEIAKLIRIPYRTFMSILGMFHFRNEWENEEKKTYIRRKTYSLDLAYQILETESSASDRDVKKAYRKLAVKHHPDKVAHLGEEYQNSAKDKFQSISEAYEKIKDRRGFS